MVFRSIERRTSSVTTVEAVYSIIASVFFFRPSVCRSFWSCGWTDTLFDKLWIERWLARLSNVCGCEAWALCCIVPVITLLSDCKDVPEIQ